MARRSSKSDGALIGLLLVVGLPLYVVSKILETTGWVAPVAVIAILILLYGVIKYRQKQSRLAYLRAKYHDEEIVRRILGECFWEGQTSEQLHESLGPPAAIDDMRLKTIKREVWKYHRTGVNRYRLRITVENDRVTAWSKKS